MYFKIFVYLQKMNIKFNAVCSEQLLQCEEKVYERRCNNDVNGGGNIGVLRLCASEWVELQQVSRLST